MYLPLLTLCVVAYNEHDYLDNILSDIYNQDYPKDKIDLIFVDSCSVDDTMEIFKCFADRNREEYNDIRIFTNHKITLPQGINVVLENAKGEVFLRIDAHAKLPVDFVSKEIAALEGHDACGGKRPCIINNDTPWNNTLLMAEESLFGSSVASYRKSEKPEFAKSLFHGAYRMDILRKIGFYDERLLRTEDNEMSYRHRKNGYKLYYDPSIVSYQYMRPDLKRMIKQKYANGKWIGITIGICPGCLMYYHFVPFLFVAAIVLTAILACLGIWWPLIAMWSAYALVAVVMSVTSAITTPKRSLCNLLLPFLFLMLHVAYGAGTFAGFFKILFNGKKYRSPKKTEG